MLRMLVSDYKVRLARLREDLERICAKAHRSPDSIRTIVVTKTHPVEAVQAVIDAGAIEIGENKVQEIVAKMPELTGNPAMHMIGHLQSNKVNKVVPLVSWIQSVDRESLLDKIDAKCAEIGRGINILVQVNTSEEDAKSGCRPEETLELCEKAVRKEHVRLRGLMTIGPLEGDENQTRRSFARLRGIGENLSKMVVEPELSMGMSGDYRWAIEEGSTMIRVGSIIMGGRNYR